MGGGGGGGGGGGFKLNGTHPHLLAKSLSPFDLSTPFWLILGMWNLTMGAGKHESQILASDLTALGDLW